eukprot:TRINITY_DN4156_c1_g3_i1.p1 TRINITY_DN4156_c1_g3~~TRINITY_DN4156_c1_g3_i1.p1  ORF type:complete len:618 (+),score=238.60 TRINITY_DN4156_c1_g3_i1:63-1916(+)
MSNNNNKNDEKNESFENIFPKVKFSKIIKVDEIEFSTLEFVPYIREDRPFIIKNSGLVGSAVENWDFEFLNKNLKGNNQTVFKGTSGKFMYWDDEKNGKLFNFKARTKKEEMSFGDFYERVKNATKYNKENGHNLEELSKRFQKKNNKPQCGCFNNREGIDRDGIQTEPILNKKDDKKKQELMFPSTLVDNKEDDSENPFVDSSKNDDNKPKAATKDELKGLSVKQLKRLLQKNRVDFRDCVEKTDLINRAFESKLSIENLDDSSSNNNNKNSNKNSSSSSSSSSLKKKKGNLSPKKKEEELLKIIKKSVYWYVHFADLNNPTELKELIQLNNGIQKSNDKDDKVQEIEDDDDLPDLQNDDSDDDISDLHVDNEKENVKVEEVSSNNNNNKNINDDGLEIDENGNLIRYYYMQQTVQEGAGEAIVRDFKKFKWDWIQGMQAAFKFGKLKANVLWAGMQGCCTPLHYDEAHNFFGQIDGRKRFYLCSPKYFPSLYPFPYHHPMDRQSQVNVYNPNNEIFPRFNEAVAIECNLEPGDVLYIPPYWWHHVENLTDGIGINFWFKMGQTDPSQLKFPLSDRQIVAIRRNTESFLGAVMPFQDIGSFLMDLGCNRYNNVDEF